MWDYRVTDLHGNVHEFSAWGLPTEVMFRYSFKGSDHREIAVFDKPVAVVRIDPRARFTPIEYTCS